jgi:hypothetical protein
MSASVAAIVFPGAALAAPGGNGPDGTGAPGNPHAPGATGNPHQPGATGNPHQGSPPYGVANGHSKSQGSPSNGSNGNSSGNGGRGNSGGSGSSNAGGASGNRPAPNGGGSGGGSPNGPPGKTTICHHTGSDTNPYVQITVANPAVANGHSHHGDLIPAPAGGCEGSEPLAQAAPSPLDGTGAPNALLGAAGAAPAVLGAATGTDPGSDSTSASASGGDDGEVAGAVAGEAADPDNEEASGQLPFTGLALGTLLAVAAMLLLGGWLIRRLGLREQMR